MDGLITLFLIVMFFVKIFGKNKKKSGAARNTQKRSSFGQALDEFEKWANDQQPATVNYEQPVRAVDRKADLQAKYGEKLRRNKTAGQEMSFEGISHPLAPSEELAAGRAPGSIAFHSDEGRDVCDPTLLHGESGLEEPAAAVFQPHTETEPFLTADDLVRGIVVSEILNRPTGNRFAKTR